MAIMEFTSDDYNYPITAKLLDFCVRVNRLCSEWEDCAVGGASARLKQVFSVGLLQGLLPHEALKRLSLPPLQSSPSDWQWPRPRGIGRILMCHVFHSPTAVQNDLSSRTLTLDCALVCGISRSLRGSVSDLLTPASSRFNATWQMLLLIPHKVSFVPHWHDFWRYCAGQNY